MTSLLAAYRRLRADEDGASFIEYTALLGVILAVSIGLITAVGTWANGVWSDLNSQVNPA